nr:MAG TPA_asm: peptidyl-prolyl cis-transisomerase [Caudoviricetes sp.]
MIYLSCSHPLAGYYKNCTKVQFFIDILTIL